MAVRDDISVLWNQSPRIISVAAPSTEITVQDLHDSLRDIEDEPGNIQHASLISTAGKENLGAGVSVGLTATLQNAQLSFEARKQAASQGTITTPDISGVSLIDSTASFIADGVKSGSWVVNLADGSTASVLVVVSETELFTDGLGNGQTNQFNLADDYKIWPVELVEVTGGNLVARDSLGNNISAVVPSVGVTIAKTSSSSATLQELQDIQFASFNGVVTIDTASVFSGTEYPAGTHRQPVNNLTDAMAIAVARGLDTFELRSDLTVSTGTDVRDLLFRGQASPTLTIQAGALTDMCTFTGLKLEGTLSGSVIIDHCILKTLSGLQGRALHSSLVGTLTLANAGSLELTNCWDGIAGIGIPTIDCNGAGCILLVAGYYGGLKIQNKSGNEDVSLNLDSARVLIENTVTAGNFIVRGVGQLIDNHTGIASVDSVALTNPIAITTAVWGAPMASHVTADSIGATLNYIKQLTNNRLEVNIGTQELILYDDDNSTVLKRWTLGTYGGEPVQTQTGVQTKRVPI